ncbi:DUF2024 family protein [Aquimarina sp. AD10]|uniref:DUF2024 family protein n=1 Tax=Aquimarina TaxID=290174 RepID=UPI000E4A237E|nr:MULTISPECIES: DUF2024 family protein [Aquimarina]AXT61099.1 DUF2024 family protein [Aquimarina sp. AD10]RKM92154.1 DUF2024 family protein [Aquimarina sp. AD10]
MKVSVYDTYVPKDEKVIMHFDILVQDNNVIENVYKYGKEYLNSKGISDFQLSTKECNFCHMEMAPDVVEKEIREKGYYIIEMENC